MPEEPRPQRRRIRGGRRRGPPRPRQAPAQPQRPAGPRETRPPAREDRRLAPRPAGRLAPREGATRGRTRRGGRGRGEARGPFDIRTGTACVILLDCREGEPDRTGQAAVFEGFFDFETGDPRRSGTGIPRLRVGDERLWGFECWWRPDSERSGLSDTDRVDLETSKKLLRGLLRDARRSMRAIR